MVRGTMREESEYLLPEDVLLPAELSSVERKDYDYTIKKGDRAGQTATLSKWVWEFRITDGEFTGLRAWGETEAELTTRAEPKGSLKLVRPWATALLGKELQVGEEFDSDDVIGLPCQITVSHAEPRQKKDGGYFYGCPVEDVFPPSTRTFQDEPPF